MSSPRHHHSSKQVPSILPIRSHFYQPARALTISARTRSMSRLSIVADSENNSTLANSKGFAMRQPLMETMVNAPIFNGGKRKTGDDGDRPKKMPRLEPTSTTPLQPSSTSRIGSSFASQSARGSEEKSHPMLKPTPARDILRQPMVEEESTSPTDSPTKNLIPRPPTPPRPHMRSDIDDVMPRICTTPNRALTPEEEPDERPIKLNSIRRLDFTKLASVAASPRRPMGPVRPLNAPNTERCQPPSTFEGTSPKADRTPITAIPVPVPVILGANSTLRAPPNPSTAPSPRRVMAGMSRLRLSTPGQSPSASRTPISSPAFCQMSSGVNLSRTSKPENHPPAIKSGMSRSDSDANLLQSARLTTQPRLAASNSGIGPEKVQEDVEMETSTSEKPLVTSALPLSAPIALPKSTSTRGFSSMGPPSRIPRGIASSRSSNGPHSRPSAVARRAESQNAWDPEPGSSASTLSRNTSVSSTISTLGKGLPSTSSTSTDEPVTRRKPSYPSSLGSGPLARPTQRMVSNPVVPPRPPSASSADAGEGPRPPHSPRSVSAPAVTSRLSISTSRREGLSLETSQRVNGLSEALEKLKMKKIESSSRLSVASSVSRPSLAASTSQIAQPRNSMTASTSMRLTSVHRPRQSLALPSGDVSIPSDTNEAADRSLAALMYSTSGGRCLKGVVAFVDVRTEEGADSSVIFGDMLRALGAKVSLTFPSDQLTERCSGIGTAHGELHTHRL